MTILKNILIGLFTGYSIYLISYKLNITSPSGLVLLGLIGLMILVQSLKEAHSVMKVVISVAAALQIFTMITGSLNTFWAKDLLSTKSKIAFDNYGVVWGIIVFGVLLYLSYGDSKKIASWKNVLWWSSVSVSMAFAAHLPFHNEIGGNTAFILFPMLVSFFYIVLTDRKTNKFLFTITSIPLFYGATFAITNVSFFEDFVMVSMYLSIAVLGTLLAFILKGEEYVEPVVVPVASSSGERKYYPRYNSSNFRTSTTFDNNRNDDEVEEDDFEQNSFPSRNYENDYSPVPSFFANDSKKETYKPNFNGIKNYTYEHDLDMEFRNEPDFVREKTIRDRERGLPAHLRSDFNDRRSSDDDDND